MLVVYWSFWIVYLMSIEGGRPGMLTEDIEVVDASIKRWLQSPCGLKSLEKVK